MSMLLGCSLHYCILRMHCVITLSCYHSESHSDTRLLMRWCLALVDSAIPLTDLLLWTRCTDAVHLQTIWNQNNCNAGDELSNLSWSLPPPGTVQLESGRGLRCARSDSPFAYSPGDTQQVGDYDAPPELTSHGFVRNFLLSMLSQRVVPFASPVLLVECPA